MNKGVHTLPQFSQQFILFGGFFHDTVSLSDYLASNTKVTGKQQTGKNLEGKSYDFINVLIWHLPVWTKENHENLNQDNCCSGQDLK
jgi:hypothetical protein